MRCESWMDLQNIILDTEVRPLKNKVTKKQFQKLWVESGDKAKKLWEKLIIKNQKYYDRDGYIDVEHQKRTYRRIPGHRGHPYNPEGTPVLERIAIRLAPEMIQEINDYSKAHNTNMSAIARELFKNFLESHK